MLVSKKLLISINPIFEKISENDFIDACNKVGIEVEEVITHHKMQNLQIGYLESYKKHPDADTLNLTTVRISPNKTVQVVCGAKNLVENKYVIYAPIGTKFLDGRIIEEKKIRGILSTGMLCGYAELTTVGNNFLSDQDNDGIIILDSGDIGDKDIAKYISNDDVIYDLSIPSNRNDLNALILLANEICIGLGKKSNINIELNSKYNKPSIKFNIDTKLVNDFSLIYIKDIKEYKTNWNDKQYLMSLGYKVHNNWLDLLNLFTIKFGNPIHIYDASKINIKKINIKLTDKLSKIKALDKNEYSIPKGTIGIYSDAELINIAGIIGLDNSKYLSNVKDIIIEVANFDFIYIRNTAEKMKISTKAQTLFSKPLSSWITQNTFYEICSYLDSNKIKFEYGYKFKATKLNKIKINIKDMEEFIGNPVNSKQCNLLSNNEYLVHPSRLDINDKYDVYEEVVKTLDINKLVPMPINFEVNKFNTNLEYKKIQKIKEYLTSINMFETKTYNLTSNDNHNLYNFFGNKDIIKLQNPISIIRETLRVSLIDEMLKVIKYNIARKRRLHNIFEFQNINNKGNTYLNLSMVFVVDLYDDKITNSLVSNNLLNIKSIVNSLSKKLNIILDYNLVDKNIPEVYGNQTIEILYKENPIGYISRVKNNILKKYDIQKQVNIVTINIEKILEETSHNSIQPISSFPLVYRDINVKLHDDKEIKSIIDNIMTISDVKDCTVKDVFKSNDQTTYTLSIKISSMSSTLETKQIENIMENVNKFIPQ